MALQIDFPTSELTHIRWKVRHFALEWYAETPIRIHKHTNSDGAAPDFSDAFIGYMNDSMADSKRQRDRSRPVDYLADSPRSRIVKAFRKLRWKAPREFFVLYGMCVIDQVGRDVKNGDEEAMTKAFEASIRRSAQRLNEKVFPGEGPHPLYTTSDVLILAVSGIRKIALWAG